jgi:hypothetical protein
MMKQWGSLSDQEKIESLQNAVVRLRTEIAEIGVDARSAKAVAEEMGRAMVVLERRLAQRENDPQF